MPQNQGLPLTEQDVLKCFRIAKRLGMTHDDLAMSLHTPVSHLRAVILQHGTQKEVMDVVKELRRGRGKDGGL